MRNEIHSSTPGIHSSIENKQIEKILHALDRARSPAPLGYISLHTGIKEPLNILEKMEKEGLVSRRPCPSWSSCMEPTFEITSRGRNHLLE